MVDLGACLDRVNIGGIVRGERTVELKHSYENPQID